MSDRLPNAIDRHIASRLRSRRLEAGITQKQLAHAVGVTFQQFQKYEGAINRISAGALYQLALALQIPVQYFFEGLTARHGALARGGRKRGKSPELEKDTKSISAGARGDEVAVSVMLTASRS
jgi:transcriptional regulator with XRE-family HTH domain